MSSSNDPSNPSTWESCPTEEDFDRVPKRSKYQPLLDQDDIKEARDNLQCLVHEQHNLIAYLEGLTNLISVCNSRDNEDAWKREQAYHQVHCQVNDIIRHCVESTDEMWDRTKNRISSATADYYNKPNKFFSDY